MNILQDADRPEIAELDCQTILKDLAREVKNAERISLKVKQKGRKKELYYKIDNLFVGLSLFCTVDQELFLMPQ